MHSPRLSMVISIIGDQEGLGDKIDNDATKHYSPSSRRPPSGLNRRASGRAAYMCILI